MPRTHSSNPVFYKHFLGHFFSEEFNEKLYFDYTYDDFNKTKDIYKINVSSHFIQLTENNILVELFT